MIIVSWIAMISKDISQEASLIEKGKLAKLHFGILSNDIPHLSDVICLAFALLQEKLSGYYYQSFSCIL